MRKPSTPDDPGSSPPRPEKPGPDRAGAPPERGAGALTWAALLGRWVEFAQASVAFPRTPEGERWRASVPSVINLQAVVLALNDLGSIPDAAERALGVDRAEVLVRTHTALLRSLWGSAVSPELAALMEDAGRAVARARQTLANR
jgi:hypothetical protein